MDRVSSYVQMRGSIPVRWTQVTSATMPKPPIQVEHMDPSFSPSRRHFADLFARYGSPVLALNLVRQSEKTPRETLIGTQFAHLVRYLNAFLPREHAVQHLPLDYSALVRCRAAPARRRSRWRASHPLAHPCRPAAEQAHARKALHHGHAARHCRREPLPHWLLRLQAAPAPPQPPGAAVAPPHPAR